MSSPTPQRCDSPPPLKPSSEGWKVALIILILGATILGLLLLQ